MKNLVLIAICLFLGSLAFTQDNVENPALVTDVETCTVTVQLEGLGSDQGDLQVALYSSEDSWLGKPFMAESVKIVDGTATVVFSNVPFGIYAISSVHDEDSNGKLNTGLMGIPSEPYANSRGAKGRFGPPKWEDAKFSLDAPTATETIKF